MLIKSYHHLPSSVKKIFVTYHGDQKRIDFNWMIDWLTDFLIDQWMDDWLIVWLIIEWLRATITLAPFWVKLWSLSESTQTPQANLCDVKRCSCVVFP